VALDMEKVAGFTVEGAEYLFIEDFINLLQPLIPSKTTYSQTEALEILQTIDYAVRRMRQQQLEYESSFSTCIRYRIFDCDINSLLYLTIAEHMGLPIYGLVLPKHMLVLWKDKEQEIYWETTEGQVRSKEFYLKKYAIEAQQSGKNMILNPLTKRDLLAVVSFNMGKAYSDKDIFEEGIRYSLEAIELRKDWSNPYSTMATIYRNMGLPENALYYSQKAIQYFPQDVESHKVMAWAYTVLGCDTEAEEVFKWLSIEAW
ncbi:MAG: transglutaminase family protein, partial [Chitinophagales bacterium]